MTKRLPQHEYRDVCDMLDQCDRDKGNLEIETHRLHCLAQDQEDTISTLRLALKEKTEEVECLQNSLLQVVSPEDSQSGTSGLEGSGEDE